MQKVQIPPPLPHTLFVFLLRRATTKKCWLRFHPVAQFTGRTQLTLALAYWWPGHKVGCGVRHQKQRHRLLFDVHEFCLCTPCPEKNGPPKHVQITLWIENDSHYFSLCHEKPSICNVYVIFQDNQSVHCWDIAIYKKMIENCRCQHCQLTCARNA